MSVNETKFLNIGKDFSKKDLIIKTENDFGDEGNPGDEFSASESKCGDIFHSTNGLFVFCCYYCSERFAAIEGFVTHFDEKHANSVITTESDEAALHLSEVQQSNEYLGLEPNEAVTCITDDPIKIEKILYTSNDESTNFLLKKVATNVEKPPKSHSETEIQCPKCPYSFRWTNLLVDHIRRLHKDYSESLLERMIQNELNLTDNEIKIVKIEGNVDESVISEWPETQEMTNLVIDNSEFEENISKQHENENKTCIDPLELRQRNEEIFGTEGPKLHYPKPYKCQHCEKIFRLKHHLKNHFGNQTIELPFPCSHCCIAFKFKDELTLHLQQNHGILSGSTEDSVAISVVEKPFKCPMCPKKFAQSRSLKEHETVHTGERPFKCTHCAETFYIKRSFQRHMKNIHGIVKTYKRLETRERNLLSLNCRYCCEAFDKIELRIAHEKSHTEVRPYQCRHCSKTFKSNQHLNQHKPFHTKEKPFKCQECPKAFPRIGGLRVHHKRVHLKEKNFSCDHCEKRFASNTDKKLHMRTHFNEKPYQCEECGKNFTTSSGLNFHKLHHTQTKRHTCEICKKSFYTTIDLRDHMPVHTKEKPYECTICGLKYSSRNNLRGHMKLHSGKKDYVCTICEKAFAQSSGLNSHMRAHGVVGNRKETEAID